MSLEVHTPRLDDWRSRLNAYFRRKAALLRPDHPIRGFCRNCWNVAVRFTGSHVQVPVHGQPVFLLNRFRSFPQDYEEAALTSFLRCIHPGDVVWDIGGNIGIYALLAARKVGERGEVVVWDANPGCCEIIRRHVQANGLESVCRVIHGAVNEGGQRFVRFWIDRDEFSTSARIVHQDSTIRSGKLLQVEAASLDDWRRRLARQPTLVKVDVEGAETLVMRGATRLLSDRSQPRPWILLAVHPHMATDFANDSGELARLLAIADYSVFSTSGEPRTPNEFSEYFAIPSESIHRFFGAIGKIGCSDEATQ